MVLFIVTPPCSSASLPLFSPRAARSSTTIKRIAAAAHPCRRRYRWLDSCATPSGSSCLVLFSSLADQHPLASFSEGEQVSTTRSFTRHRATRYNAMVSEKKLASAVDVVERSCSASTFYPPAYSRVPGPRHLERTGNTDTSRPSKEARVRSRKRSYSQNHLYIAVNHDMPPASRTEPSLQLRRLPLPALSAAAIDLVGRKVATTASASVLQPSHHSVALTSGSACRIVGGDGVKAATNTGNQEDSNECNDLDVSIVATTDEFERDDSNQLDDIQHTDSVALTAVELLPTCSTASSGYFAPRLATLDHCGDSLLQSPSSSSLSQASLPSPAAQQHEREQTKCVCYEILSTELSYVRDLKTLLRHFFVPLQEFALKYTINLGSMGALHASIRTILHIHTELLRQLTAAPSARLKQPWEERTSNFGGDDDDFLRASDDWSGSALSRATSSTPRSALTLFDSEASSAPSVEQVTAAFDFTIEYMKVYAFYCSSYLRARDELALLQTKHTGLNALTTQLNEHARRDLRADIVSLMIKPVQRICQYPLLFRELLKHAASSAEAERIEKTLRKIESVSVHVNERVREAQNNARLFELHETIDPRAKIDLLQPSRMLLSELTARVLSLDSPRWPSFLLRLGSRRRRRLQRADASSLGGSCSMSSGSSRISDALLSPRSHCSSSLVSSPLSRSGLTSPTSSVSTRPPLLRRGSSGERLRLILLSDVLLMAKKQEEKLKIKRQLCLSCAHVACDEDASARSLWSFTMEAAKVGRCHCHHLTPVTLKRSPKRRTSVSLVRPGDGVNRTSTNAAAPQPVSSTQQQQQPRSSTVRSGGFFRASELASAFRASKRYVVMCESEQKRDEFVAALATAITRSARLPVAKASSLAFPTVSDAAKFPVRLWRSLKAYTSSYPAASSQQHQEPRQQDASILPSTEPTVSQQGTPNFDLPSSATSPQLVSNRRPGTLAAATQDTRVLRARSDDVVATACDHLAAL